MIRGIGDPLVAAYARCYLIRIGVSVYQCVSANREYMKESFVDFLATYHTVRIDLNLPADLSNRLLLYSDF